MKKKQKKREADKQYKDKQNKDLKRLINDIGII